MAEENQDEDQGQEVFLDDQTDSSAEDTSEEKAGAKSENEVVEAAERVESGEDELQDYSASVQKRIKSLTHKYREAERQQEEATRVAQQLLQENQQLKGRMEKLDTGYLSEYGARIESQIGAARKAYKYAAFGIHRKLVEEEGFDPQSDEYYNEIDRRMRSEFPNKFSGQKSSRKSQVASAASSASRNTKQGRRSVKLSPSQIAIAKKLNVPLEEYAKYVKE